jgi:hypothetical protein
VLAEGEVVMKVIAAPEDTPWMWTLAYGQQIPASPISCIATVHPTHGFKPTHEAAMAAFARAVGNNRTAARTQAPCPSRPSLRAGPNECCQ